MSTLAHYIGIILHHRNDQPVWNGFLMEYDFRQILFQTLDPNLFVNGNQWTIDKNFILKNKLSNHIWLAHSSWTSNHIEKITKLKILQAWYFNQTCHSYYQTYHNLIPSDYIDHT